MKIVYFMIRTVLMVNISTNCRLYEETESITLSFTNQPNKNVRFMRMCIKRVSKSDDKTKYCPIYSPAYVMIRLDVRKIPYFLDKSYFL